MSRGWGVLTYLILKPKLKLIRNSKLKLKNITHTQTDVLKSPSDEMGGIDITHTPPKLMCSSLQVKRWGVVLTLHIPLPHQTNVLNYPSWGGVYLNVYGEGGDGINYNAFK